MEYTVLAGLDYPNFCVKAHPFGGILKTYLSLFYYPQRIRCLETWTRLGKSSKQRLVQMNLYIDLFKLHYPFNGMRDFIQTRIKQ